MILAALLRAGLTYKEALSIPYQQALALVKEERLIREEQWEQARLIALMIARVNGSSIRPEEIIELPSDKERLAKELAYIKEQDKIYREKNGTGKT